MNHLIFRWGFLCQISLLLLLSGSVSGQQAGPLVPDLTVAPDGSGNFKTVSEAVASLEITDSHRVVIYILDGVYSEQVTINRPNVMLRDQSRKGTRIAYDLPRRDPKAAGPPAELRGVVNLFADGIVLENLTVENTYPFRRHTFTLYGRGSFVLTSNCDFIAEGNDTVALWARGGGLYYHTNCHFQGNIDYLCPRGWCYVSNSTFFEVDTRAALWHDGGKDPRKKLVIRNSSFDGAKDYALGCYPRDWQFYLIGCQFSQTTQDVIDTNAPAEPTDDFRWGRRVFFYDCHRTGGDATWHADNLTAEAGAPKPEHMTPSWTFEGCWNPERTDVPQITEVRVGAPNRVVEVVFSEPVTVRGTPQLKTKNGKTLRWTEVNGTNTLTFALLDENDAPLALELGQGRVFATLATTEVRDANLSLPAPQEAGKQRRKLFRKR